MVKKTKKKKLEKKIIPKKLKVKKALKKVKEPVLKKTVSRIIDSTVHKTKIRVIGIGGGGSTIVSEIASRIKKADFYVANTDAQALKEAGKGIKKFQFGQNLTKGLGTGMNSELGEAAALEEKDKIQRIIENQDLCIMIASLGGGTSSGAGPVFAKIAKNLGNLSYGIFTLPFEFEGEKKMKAALEALEKIKPYFNIYTVIPNERIFQIVDKNTPLKDALSAINERLADNLEGLIEMIYLPGLINIDFADLSTILSGRGRLAYLNTVEIDDLGKEDSIKKVILSPLHPYSIKGAKGILYNIVSGKEIQLLEVSKISNVISESVNKSAKIIFGISQNNKYKNRAKITLLATGCSAKGFLASAELKEEKPKVKKPKKKIVIPEKKTEIDIEKLDSEDMEKLLKEKERIISSIDDSIKALKSKEEPKKPVEKKVVVKKEEPKEEPKKLIQAPVVKLRKNALQVKKDVENEENEILEQEKVWEIPAILRKKTED